MAAQTEDIPDPLPVLAYQFDEFDLENELREEDELRMEREEDGFDLGELAPLEGSECPDILLLKEEEDLGEVENEHKSSKADKRANASSSNPLPLDAPEVDSAYASASFPARQPADEAQKCNSSSKRRRKRKKSGADDQGTDGPKRKRGKNSLKKKWAGLDQRKKDKRKEDAARRAYDRSLRPNALKEA
ncbi:hypothetical protein E1B28_005114 [Marasmius oreades]|uniref:Uncharacterized protein n=1 Tax=Marasmius oreades TaxID=181124 RepID=A0A9P7UZY3_9AGAR|nr:uncharacterized protein E1B28_005114 [Marasmius oreades]KAG7097795.1 hypothetical protein E1B28_005114 [Marasmius oreades]